MILLIDVKGNKTYVNKYIFSRDMKKDIEKISRRMGRKCIPKEWITKESKLNTTFIKEY